MSSDNDDESVGRTHFAPNPGGRRGGAKSRAQTENRTFHSGPAQEIYGQRFGVNPLIDAAGDLFGLIIYLRGQTRQIDPVELREEVVSRLGDYRNRITQIYQDNATAVYNRARYAICAVIDDVIVSHAWGKQIGWARHSLITTVYREAPGGERFFDLLEAVQDDAVNKIDDLELMYVCLSLGFEGKYRLMPDGAAKLEALRSRLYQTIESLRDDTASTLSRRAKGAETTRRRLGAFLPTWVIGAGTVAVGGLMFYLFQSSSYIASAEAVERSKPIPPASISILRPAVVEDPVDDESGKSFIEDTVSFDVANDFRALFADLIAEGILEGPFIEGSQMRMRINAVAGNRVMFASGRAEVNPYYRTVLDRIGAELGSRTAGRIDVEGYSDSAALSGGPYYTNQRLAEARAKNAADILWGVVGQPQRPMVYHGYAWSPQNDAYPDNGDIPDPRDRRIEILLPAQTARRAEE